MNACPSCSCHVRAGEASCPHCGAVLGGATLRRTAAAALMGLALIGCDGKGQALYGVPDTGPQAEYGVADTGNFVDDDGDGWTEAEGDCDDTAETVHPEAAETAGDGVDSNCDGQDDT